MIIKSRKPKRFYFLESFIVDSEVGIFIIIITIIIIIIIINIIIIIIITNINLVTTLHKIHSSYLQKNAAN